MSDANRKSKLSVLLAASLITTNLVFAGDAYKNNVVDVKVNKESGNSVKVTIFTDRPYTEPVVVNKKANNKYVILMPETKSSLKSAPSVTNASGTVSNVSVNTQAVSGGKGYTKIIITSEKAINVVPRTQQLSTASKTASHASTHKTTTAAAEQAKAKQLAAQKAAQQKAQQEAKAKQLAAQKAQQEAKAKQLAAQKAAQQKAQQEAKAKQLAAQKAAQQKAQQEAKAKQLAAQKAAQQKAQNVAVKYQEKAQNTGNVEPIEVLENEIKTDTNAKFVQNNNDSVLNQEVQDNINKTHKKKQTVINETNNKKSVIDNIKAVIKDYENVCLWKLLLLAGAITFPLVVIFVILALDKKINRRIDKSFKKEEPNYAQNEQVYEPITQDVKPIEPVQQKEAEDAQSFNSFEEMLNHVDKPVPTFHEEQIHKAEYTKFEQSVHENQIDENNNPQEAEEPQNKDIDVQEPEVISEEQFTNDFVDDDFEHDFTNKQETVDDAGVQPPETIGEKQEIVPAEQQTRTPEEPYMPDGYLSDFAGVNDKEFFDELVLQSMAENNANGLPEESPADEIFDFMSDDEPAKAETNKKSVTPEPVQANTVDESVKTPAETPAAVPVQNIDVPANNVPVIEPVKNSAVSEKPAVEKMADSQNESSQDDDLTMLTEVKLNESTGLYLVNYENFSSLVGHIDDDYFVIKKFDDIVNGNIILKQTEKLKNATRYLVRVGKNKMVVEVSATSMNRLLDL